MSRHSMCIPGLCWNINDEKGVGDIVETDATAKVMKQCQTSQSGLYYVH